jgi:hydrogenase assembly chaperone HypC/HupF
LLMCLAVVGRILSTRGEGVTRVGVVDLGGAPREVGLALVPEAVTGTWVTVHAGMAIGTRSEDEAVELAEISDEIARLL